MKKKAVSIILFVLFMCLSACGKKETADISLQTTEEKESQNKEETKDESGTEPIGGMESDAMEAEEGENSMAGYDFSVFTNVELIGADLSEMSDDQLSVLYQQARYCQAMTEADTDTLRKIVSEDAVFTHMSGRQQTREEYFADIENGSLRYFTIGIDSPVVEVDGDMASVAYTSVLNANAYGARGTYQMSGTHWFEKRDGSWVSINDPNQ